jgi:hypothetical protein
VVRLEILFLLLLMYYSKLLQQRTCEVVIIYRDAEMNARERNVFPVFSLQIKSNLRTYDRDFLPFHKQHTLSSVQERLNQLFPHCGQKLSNEFPLAIAKFKKEANLVSSCYVLCNSCFH